MHWENAQMTKNPKKEQNPFGRSIQLYQRLQETGILNVTETERNCCNYKVPPFLAIPLSRFLKQMFSPADYSHAAPYPVPSEGKAWFTKHCKNCDKSIWHQSSQALKFRQWLQIIRNAILTLWAPVHNTYFSIFVHHKQEYKAHLEV